jgi:hypothetical protein
VAGISQRIDLRIVDKIDGLVEDGVWQVNEVKRQLKVFVRDSLLYRPNGTNDFFQ